MLALPSLRQRSGVLRGVHRSLGKHGVTGVCAAASTAPGTRRSESRPSSRQLRAAITTRRKPFAPGQTATRWSRPHSAGSTGPRASPDKRLPRRRNTSSARRHPGPHRVRHPHRQPTTRRRHRPGPPLRLTQRIPAMGALLHSRRLDGLDAATIAITWSRSRLPQLAGISPLGVAASRPRARRRCRQPRRQARSTVARASSRDGHSFRRADRPRRHHRTRGTTPRVSRPRNAAVASSPPIRPELGHRRLDF